MDMNGTGLMDTKVMVVDDDPAVLSYLAMVLKTIKFSPIVAANADEALMKFKAGERKRTAPPSFAILPRNRFMPQANRRSITILGRVVNRHLNLREDW